MINVLFILFVIEIASHIIYLLLSLQNVETKGLLLYKIFYVLLLTFEGRPNKIMYCWVKLMLSKII